MRFRSLFLAVFIILTIPSCYLSRQVVRDFQGQNIRVDSNLDADPAIVTLLLPYRKKKDSAMQTIIGYAGVPLTKAQPECTMGNFVADAVLAAAKERDKTVQAAIVNYGGLRLAYLSPGPLRLGDLYQLMPFDDPIVLLDIPGKTLLQLCDHIAAYGGWPVSGLRFQIHKKQAIHVCLNGHPVNPHLVYRIAVPDYLANGGDYCDFLRKCPQIKQNVLVRNALIHYVRRLQEKNQKLRPGIENRIAYAP